MLKKQTNRRIVGDVRLHGFNVMSLSPNDSGVHGVNGAHVYKLLLLKKYRNESFQILLIIQNKSRISSCSTNQ